MNAGTRLAALSLMLPLVLATGGEAQSGNLVPPSAMDPETPWTWVVPRVVLQADEDWTLSGVFSGLGEMVLDLQLVDREGEIAAEAPWELVGGRPTDYRLAGLRKAPRGVPLSLVVSGLDVRPTWLALSLWRGVPPGASEEVGGAWIRSDPSWLPGVRGGP